MPPPSLPARALACVVLGLLPSSLTGQATGAQGGEQAGVRPIDVEAAPRPVLRAVRTGRPITLDGVVDMEEWAAAEVATRFVQSKPNTGWPATERTEVRILYDDERLYIGAILYDSEPEQLIAQRMEQDFMSRDEDVFGFALDTFLDRANAYYIFTNPNGAIRDAQAYDNSRASNAEWEGIIQVRTTVHDEGWSAEFVIPFSTLRFDPGATEQVWGLNMLRRIRRKGEDALWAPVAFRTRLHKMDEAGTLVGLEGLRAGRNITVKPYALGGDVRGSAPTAAERGLDGDVGLDVKWGVTPQTTLDLTWNTDFSQVEVDQEQVNLTRFGLFFPEKRDFFIESQGTYQFGDLAEREYRLGAGPRDFTLFHSRRIGLTDGRPVPIHGGARVTQRASDGQFGLLSMVTEDERFLVARGRRSVGPFDLGAIYVDRSETGSGGGHNRSWGVDANAKVAGNLIVHSYLAGTHEPGPDSDNLAGRLSAAWRDAFWNVSALYRTFGENFRPDVGFVRRTGVEHGYGTVGVHPRVGLGSIIELNPYVELEHFTDPAGTLETRNVSAGLGAVFLDGASLVATATDRFEGVDDPFTVSGEVIPAGRYAFREAAVTYTASAARTLSGSVRASGGGYFQGDRRSFGGNVIWRPSAHVALDVGGEHNVIDLTGVPFTVDVVSARLDYSFTTKLLVGAWVQYNDATDELVSNARLHFIHSPLSDLFVVYSERRAADTDVVLDRRFTVKATKLFAF